MCTAISCNRFFGRNLDLERGFSERVVITPRNYNFPLRKAENLTNHYAIIGMATVVDGIPLYFDATNEKGLSMAGLNFPNNAVYHPNNNEKTNIAPFEFIPFILGKCQNVDEAEKLLLNINLVNIDFSDKLPNTPLHWVISDNKKSLTVESVREGLNIYENKIGVLTNNPPFSMQVDNLEKYRNLFKVRSFKNDGSISYSLGLDAVGLPGDFSSQSRFVKAAFVKERTPNNLKGDLAINHFFHILSSIAMPKGCVFTPSGECEYTRYSSCCDGARGDYYYTTYNNNEKVKVSLWDYDLESINIFQTRQIYDL